MEDPTITEQINHDQSLKVTRVPEQELKFQAEGSFTKVKIKQGTWQEIDAGIPIENTGASPCLIVYVKDLTNNSMISGHFPNTNKERIMGFAKDTIDRKAAFYQKQATEKPGLVLVDSSELKRLKDTIDKDYQAYKEMLARIQELAKEKGENNLEVYLFGQNFPFYDSESLSEGALEQHNVTNEFTLRGIPLTNIHNYRSIGVDKVDDTFYSPENSAILHSTRK